MTFLNPLLLLGLAAAAIPLIIHLFNFRKPRKVDFSTLAFLKELQKSTMRRVRIKQWVLLLLRTLAIASLVLAFARPTLTGSGILGGRAPSSVAIVLDNSLSMSLRDERGGFLDQAKAFAAGIVEQMAPDDEITLLPTDGQADTRPATFHNAQNALDAIQDIMPRAGATTTSQTIANAGALLAKSDHLNREIYVISDLQGRTLSDSVVAQIPVGIRVAILPVGSRNFANVGVTDVRIASRIIEIGQPVRVEATLVNYGESTLDGYVASVYLEGKRVAQSTADLEPGLPATVSFAATPESRGWLAGVVQIEDDAFEYDNVRYFTLNVPERRRVLVVKGVDQRTDYLELALSPNLVQNRVAFETVTIPENALPAAGLGAYDAVILVGLRTISSGEVAEISRYIEAGGGMMIFPGAEARAEDYNALFAELQGGSFTGFSGNLGPGHSIAKFDRVDYEHPLFEGVFEQADARKNKSVESPDIYFSMDYTPGSEREQTLIRQSNGHPFLEELRHGLGATFLLSVAPDPRWSDLPVRGLFIPLLYRSMYYLSAGETAGGENLVVGKAGTLRLSGVPETTLLRLVSPSGDSFMPEQRHLYGAVLVKIDDTFDSPGAYEVRAGEKLERRVAFNLDNRESDLHRLTGEAAAKRLGDALSASIRVLDVDDVAQLAERLSTERTGVELWNVFLMLALVFLLAEMMVARQWRPEGVTV